MTIVKHVNINDNLRETFCLILALISNPNPSKWLSEWLFVQKYRLVGRDPSYGSLPITTQLLWGSCRDS